MIVTIFRSRLRPEAENYHAVAEEMLRLAQGMPGFVSFKTFRHEDGERCSIVEFRDEASHRAWAQHPRHRVAQQQGRDEFYEEYSITIAQVERNYNFRRATDAEDAATIDST